MNDHDHDHEIPAPAFKGHALPSKHNELFEAHLKTAKPIGWRTERYDLAAGAPPTLIGKVKVSEVAALKRKGQDLVAARTLAARAEALVVAGDTKGAEKIKRRLEAKLARWAA